jgi:hypothetical protein
MAAEKCRSFDSSDFGVGIKPLIRCTHTDAGGWWHRLYHTISGTNLSGQQARLARKVETPFAQRMPPPGHRLISRTVGDNTYRNNAQSTSQPVSPPHYNHIYTHNNHNRKRKDNPSL